MSDVSLDTLDAKTDAVRTADIQLVQELSDDLGPLRRRDEKKDEIREHLIGTRGSAEKNFGFAALNDLGLPGEVPKDGTRLATSVEQIIATMTNPDLAMPDPLPWGAAVSSTTWADLLRPLVADPKAEIAAVGAERREVNEARAARDGAVEVWLVDYRSCANLLSEFLSYVGLQDLVDRVRPTERRSRGIDPPPEVPNRPQEA